VFCCQVCLCLCLIATVICLVTASGVGYLGYGRHGTCHGRHFDGGAKNCLAKIKNFIYSLLNLYFAPHTTINCKTASTRRARVLLIKPGVSCQHALPRIMTKLCYCDITRRSDIVICDKTRMLACHIYKTLSFSRNRKC